jgi:hypothetical protein
MEHFIDSLSKQLTKTTSRRSMLSLASRTLFASFVTSTGIGRLWGSSTTTLSSTQVCPSCGTCQQCNTKARKCGQDCENPCTAAALCSQAQQFPPYVTLQSFLGNQFTATGEPQALVFMEPSVSQTEVLGTTYTGTDLSKTATLFFTFAPSGTNAYAVQYSNGTPQFGYFVDPLGQVQQLVPPYQLPSPASAAGVRAATQQQQTAAANATSTCKALVSEICDVAGAVASFESCVLVAAGYCAEAILVGPEAPVICDLVLIGVCTLRAFFVPNLNLCAPFFSKVFCNCSAGQQPCGSGCCGACQTCSNGACVPTVCPSGYSCSSATGTCSCDNFCGTMCCSSGETCCGTSCCAADQTCSNGTCVTSCPSGTTPCGPSGRCCAVCCPNGTATPFCGDVGETCCGTAGLCPQGSYCCNSTAGVCAQNGGICCTSSTGVSFACNPGEVCCGNKCAGVCCGVDASGNGIGCPAGESCCGSGANTICCGAGCCSGTITVPACTC